MKIVCCWCMHCAFIVPVVLRLDESIWLRLPWVPRIVKFDRERKALTMKKFGSSSVSELVGSIENISVSDLSDTNVRFTIFKQTKIVFPHNCFRLETNSQESVNGDVAGVVDLLEKKTSKESSIGSGPTDKVDGIDSGPSNVPTASAEETSVE